MDSKYYTEKMGAVSEDAAIAKYPKLVDFEETFRNTEDALSWRVTTRQAIAKRVAACDIKKSFLQLFPIINTLKSYSVQDVPNDIIAGLTAGIMMIPQGMAFAALSTLPPIVGLYISFFSSLTYFFFGTGKQLSWGCIAIISLMIATLLDKYDNSLLQSSPLTCVNESMQHIGHVEIDVPFNYSYTSNDALFNNSFTSNSSSIVSPYGSILMDKVDAAKMATRIRLASGVTLVAGIVLVIASRLGLSQITSLMSNSMITGFTVGISFHVATSQFKTIFGIKVPHYKGPGAIIRTWFSVLWNLPKTNVAALITFLISFLALYLVKRFVNEKYKKHLRIPIPIELIVVIVATVISNYVYLHDNFNVKVVETVPVGVPAPTLPDFFLIADYISDGIVIMIIAFAQTLAMAKTMALKNNYVIDPNQEMLACGMCSVVCGLFSGYVASASVSRSVVQDGAGGKTQVASIFSAVLVLLVIMLIGPYFYYLPMCVLSAVIIVNLLSMFLKLLEIPAEWRRSRYDCAVWVFSCISCIVLNADVGLLAGILFSVFLVVLRTMLAPVAEVGEIETGPLTVQLRSLEKYTFTKQFSNIKIIRIETPLYFINADIFTAKVFKKTGIDPSNINKEMKVSKPRKEKSDRNGFKAHESHEKMIECNKETPLTVVILDASGVSFIDLMGVQALQLLITELTSVQVEVLITSVPESIIPMLKSTGFWNKHGDRLFLTVEAALASLATVVESKEGSRIDTELHAVP